MEEKMFGILEEVAKRFGTSVYAYEEQKIIDQFRKLNESIDWQEKMLLFAMKANSNRSILDIFKQEGAGVDAVSPGEVHLALQAGFEPHQILFTGNNITDKEMEFVADIGVMPNIDSLSRLEKYGKKYPGNRVYIRINPDVGAGHHDHCITGGSRSKFGIWYSEADKAAVIAKEYNLTIVGIHQHIGSQILDKNKFLEAMEMLLKVAPEFEDLRAIDFGGGFGVPYTPDEKPLDIGELGEKISSRFRRFCEEYGRELYLIFEPGRYFTAEAGHFLTRVNTIKVNPDHRKFVGVDSGSNQFPRPMIYGSYHEIINVSNPKDELEYVDVVGNVCESGDRFAEQRRMPSIIEGDLLSIENAGAYCFSMTSNYNYRERPPEVLIVRDKTLVLIRNRESVMDWE